jgi:hypothetical protein
VHRGEVDRRALRQALAVLAGGGILAVAPEGTRSDSGVLQRGREGAAYLAARSGVQLLPVVAYGQAKRRCSPASDRATEQWSGSSTGSRSGCPQLQGGSIASSCMSTQSGSCFTWPFSSRPSIVGSMPILINRERQSELDRLPVSWIYLI